MPLCWHPRRRAAGVCSIANSTDGCIHTLASGVVQVQNRPFAVLPQRGVHVPGLLLEQMRLAQQPGFVCFEILIFNINFLTTCGFLLQILYGKDQVAFAEGPDYCIVNIKMHEKIVEHCHIRAFVPRYFFFAQFIVMHVVQLVYRRVVC